MTPHVSIVILTHNNWETTSWCVKGLVETSYRPLEVIFVDNGSTDGTPEHLKELSFPASDVTVTVIRNESNCGCSTARNQGADAARGSFLVFMDNDVVVRTRAWIEGLLTPFSDPGVAISGPKLVFPFPPYRIQFAGGAVTPSGRVLFMGRGARRTDSSFNAPREVQCVISACMLIRKEAFREAGGFDELYNPVQFEDIDLCYRVRSAGLTARYVPHVEMYHFENSTTQRTGDVRGTYQIIRNGMLFKKRWHHMFAEENGPAEEEARWAELDTHNLLDVQDLEFL